MKAKILLFILALGLMASNVFAQTPASFLSIPPDQYGQGNFNNCDTSGLEDYMDIQFLSIVNPDTFSLFVVENVRNYPVVSKIRDTLIMVRDSKTKYHYKIRGVDYLYNITTDLSNPTPSYYISYYLPVFSSYQQWRNSFVQIHFKIKGNNTLYTVKDTTVRLGFVFKPNLTVNGFLLSSDNYANIYWYKNYPGGTPLYTGLQTIPLLSDGIYCAFQFTNDYHHGNYSWACTTQTSLTFKAIKDSLSNGNLQVPFITGASYQWYFQGNIIPMATSNTYQAIKSGNYSVSVTFDFEQTTVNQRTEGSNTVTGSYSYNYTAVVTNLETNIVDPKAKTLVRIYNLLGQTIKPEDAIQGMFIYQYSDGSPRKIMKLE